MLQFTFKFVWLFVSVMRSVKMADKILRNLRALWALRWVRSRRCGCLVTWFCCWMIAKPSNKITTALWADPDNMCMCYWWLCWPCSVPCYSLRWAYPRCHRRYDDSCLGDRENTSCLQGGWGATNCISGDGLVQNCSNSSANALDLLQSCTKPSISLTSLQCVSTGVAAVLH